MKQMMMKLSSTFHHTTYISQMSALQYTHTSDIAKETKKLLEQCSICDYEQIALVLDTDY